MISAIKKLPEPKDQTTVLKIWEGYAHKRDAAFAEIIQIAEDAPTSPVAFEALKVLFLEPESYDAPCFVRALALLRMHYVRDPRIGKQIAVLGYYLPHDNEAGFQQAVGLLTAVVESNPDRNVRAQAALGLARLAKRTFVLAESNSADDAEPLAAAAENQLEKVLRDYGECENLRTRGVRPATATVRGEVEPELYELRHLRIGKPAPEIEGNDLDGAPLKLSEYRGKVNLVVFWASWCGPCMEDVPHERELVERFKGRPFVIVGINGDEEIEAAREAVTRHTINWRSFWNGAEGAGGPIAVAWNVRGWPKVYVIDHNGVIRHKYLRGERLDGFLETIVAEAETSANDRNK
ncbi:MAG: TlpA disulfide reductase family protein [Pirellulales bacterium]